MAAHNQIESEKQMKITIPISDYRKRTILKIMAEVIC